MKIIFLSNKSIAIIATILILFGIYLLSVKAKSVPTSVTQDQLKQDIMQVYLLRDKAALEANAESVRNQFDIAKKVGRWAYEHEKLRIEYLRDWGILRGASFTSIESDIRIQRVREKGESLWVDFLHSGKFTYVYNDAPNNSNSFGIGTRRTMELVNIDDKWIIKREWYLDPFEDTLDLPDELVNASTIDPPVISETPMVNLDESILTAKTSKRYDREKAVTYADKYCGATFGSGNDYRYNKKFRDFTYLGGDCANFASQMLVEGGLKMTGGWFYNPRDKNGGGGTRSWLKAVGLKDYLLNSGRARLITKGTLEQVSKSSSKYPGCAYSQLEKGDIICYEKKNGNCHISIITGFDSKGWPLVNSHSTDRYRVPWDMGWTTKSTKYWLLNIKD